jgi:hypothetical protein
MHSHKNIKHKTFFFFSVFSGFGLLSGDGRASFLSSFLHILVGVILGYIQLLWFTSNKKFKMIDMFQMAFVKQ